MRLQKKRWRANNIEYARAYQRKWNMENGSRIRAEERTVAHRRRIEILDFLGGKCHCGFSDWRALQIDHVNGGGVKHHRELYRNIVKFYADIRKNPKKYQVLCANCNWIKRYEKQETKPII